VKIGAMIFATDQTLPLHRLAPEVEARGFESLWIPEKTHVPTSRRTPWPGGPELPEFYKRTGAPLVALAAAAAVTDVLRVGTGILLAAVRDPVILAKEIATLDWLSGGRFELGVAYGWNAEEHATHGVDLAHARPLLADKIALMNALWNHDEAGYEGPYVRVDPSWSWPKPIQRPRPPIHIGSTAPYAFDDIAAWADGWLPIEGTTDIPARIPRLRATFEQAGRPPDDAVVTVTSSMGDPATLERYEQAGVDRAVVWLPPEDPSTVLAALDTHAKRLEPWLTAGSGASRSDQPSEA
jgi:probable F420-dependent oxidoreductase